MNPSVVLVLAFLIGVIAGLRSLTAPAVVAYAAHRGWLNLAGTPFVDGCHKGVDSVCAARARGVCNGSASFHASADERAGTIARIIMDALCGACVAAAGAASVLIGGVLGVVGGIAGAFGGYHARTGLLRALKVPDFVIACVEHLLAVGGGLFIVSRF